MCYDEERVVRWCVERGREEREDSDGFALGFVGIGLMVRMNESLVRGYGRVRGGTSDE